jgi:hypothetical protein
MARAYVRLPIDADEGFPQAFRLGFGDATYHVTLYVNVLEDAPPEAEDVVYELPRPDAFMVMTVAREAPAEPDVIFRRKLVLDHEYEARELAFVFRELRVDRRNLNGIGSFGSSVTGGVAARWAS